MRLQNFVNLLDDLEENLLYFLVYYGLSQSAFDATSSFYLIVNKVNEFTHFLLLNPYLLDLSNLRIE